jgi:hypothetical protein
MSQYSTNFQPKVNLQTEMKSYIHLASHGHFPLFFKEWLQEGITTPGPMSFQVANRNVKETFKKLSRHRTEQKKKTALTGLEKKERDIFVKSFIKVVEHSLLKDLKTLH